ncbi:hypothetical protein EV194_1166 [Natronoflexus pectinivorans]|uniref:Uncharacterized protein n=1 Tax=Natronoflexus pectinivorans TaxID=682526 RepID=A0A4V2RVS4_9BACT|nr:hypothetical protein EV194_1166 [Natronoflexus pectinivorans]
MRKSEIENYFVFKPTIGIVDMQQISRIQTKPLVYAYKYLRGIAMSYLNMFVYLGVYSKVLKRPKKLGSEYSKRPLSKKVFAISNASPFEFLSARMI